MPNIEMPIFTKNICVCFIHTLATLKYFTYTIYKCSVLDARVMLFESYLTNMVSLTTMSHNVIMSLNSVLSLLPESCMKQRTPNADRINAIITHL